MSTVRLDNLFDFHIPRGQEDRVIPLLLNATDDEAFEELVFLLEAQSAMQTESLAFGRGLEPDKAKRQTARRILRSLISITGDRRTLPVRLLFRN